jgi:hypothetical protein
MSSATGRWRRWYHQGQPSSAAARTGPNTVEVGWAARVCGPAATVPTAKPPNTTAIAARQARTGRLRAGHPPANPHATRASTPMLVHETPSRPASHTVASSAPAQ